MDNLKKHILTSKIYAISFSVLKAVNSRENASLNFFPRSLIIVRSCQQRLDHIKHYILEKEKLKRIFHLLFATFHHLVFLSKSFWLQTITFIPWADV